MIPGYDSSFFGNNAAIVATECGSIQAWVCETRVGANVEIS
jgi:hypothetical protein